MALIKCEECGGVIAKTAKVCPHCGAKNKRPPGLIGALLVILVATLVYQCASQDTGPGFAEKLAAMTPEQREAEFEAVRRSEAKWDCRAAVEKSLKAPTTATFQHYKQFSAAKTEEGNYTVTGYVDAQNSFGAMVRTTFVCEMVRVGDQWIAASVTTVE